MKNFEPVLVRQKSVTLIATEIVSKVTGRNEKSKNQTERPKSKSSIGPIFGFRREAASR